MKITGKKREIKDFAEWEDAFGGNNWKDGYSACSLAKYFTEPNIESSKGLQKLTEILTAVGYNDVEYIEAEIEHESEFDEYKNGRKHDLMINAKNGDGSICICIEAKVNEKFGNNNVAKEYDNAIKLKEKGSKSEKFKRIRKLCNDIFRINIEDNKFENNEEIGELRYQLLYYFAGSLVDAKHADVVFMPVLVFHEYKKRDSNLKAYKLFMELFPLKDRETIISDDGTMTIYKGKYEGVTIISCYATIGRI
jgi:hypothetical protein